MKRCTLKKKERLEGKQVERLKKIQRQGRHTVHPNSHSLHLSNIWLFYELYKYLCSFDQFTQQ